MDAYDVLKSVHDDALVLAASLNFDKTHRLHFHAIALYGSVVEYASSIVFLKNGETKIAIPVVFRSLLEAHVDLVNLCNDSNYGYSLELDFIRNWLDFLGTARRGENPYLAPLGEHQDVPEEIRTQKARQKEILDNGHPRLEIKDKFRLADLEDEHAAIYSMLCAYSHNSLRALRDRHAEVEGEDFQMTFYKDPEPEKFEYFAEMALDLVVRSTELIHKMLESGEDEAVEKLRQYIVEYREQGAA